jgi:hypothetical protein
VGGGGGGGGRYHFSTLQFTDGGGGQNLRENLAGCFGVMKKFRIPKVF